MADRRPLGWFISDEGIAAIAERYRAGESGPAIARDLGCSPATVYKALRLANQPLRRGWFSSDEAIDVIAERYRAGDDGTAIARDLGCSFQTVYTALELADIPRRPRRGTLSPEAVREIVARRQQGETCPAIAADHGTTARQISRVCIRRGVRRPTPLALDPAVAARIEQRLQDGDTRTAIARDLGCSRQHVERIASRCRQQEVVR